jgi:hypothetical protein
MASPMPKDDRPPLVAPRTVNPFAEAQAGADTQARDLIAVEQQRAIAEVQARMIIARANPRDPRRTTDKILNDCTRVTLADHAIYQYARGGTDIRGPTIRLAEAIAQRWGNIASGIKEIARRDGYSECVAYAWDLETGYYDERQFQVRHWRDRKQGGGYQLTDERDIYELIANFGQRRKRAVLLTVIPGDVVEAALEQCEKTMQAGADVTPEGIKKLAEAFAEFGVIQTQIETRIQRRLDAIRPAQVVMLRKIYNSLRDGISTAADWFDEPEAARRQRHRPRHRPGRRAAVVVAALLRGPERSRGRRAGATAAGRRAAGQRAGPRAGADPAERPASSVRGVVMPELFAIPLDERSSASSARSATGSASIRSSSSTAV